MLKMSNERNPQENIYKLNIYGINSIKCMEIQYLCSVHVGILYTFLSLYDRITYCCSNNKQNLQLLIIQVFIYLNYQFYKQYLMPFIHNGTSNTTKSKKDIMLNISA